MPHFVVITFFLYLCSSVFDFLTPATPRSAKLFGGLTSRDLGDKSPRLSPRITLPEAPTDLSCGARGQPQEVDEAAEDLSMASKANKVTPPPPLQCLEPPVKQEYSRPSSVVKQEYQSRYVKIIEQLLRLQRAEIQTGAAYLGILNMET